MSRMKKNLEMILIACLLAAFLAPTVVDPASFSSMMQESRLHVLLPAGMNKGTSNLPRDQGYLVGEEKNLHIIGIDGYSFDTRIGVPELPDDLRISDYPENVMGHYIVQFIGPVKEEWKEAVEQLGGIIGDYIPYNAFDVKAFPQTRAAIEDLSSVQWVGPFQPAYRVKPELWSREGLFDVEIITYDGKDVNRILEFLPTSSVIKAFADEEFGMVVARIDITLLPLLASLPEVEYIEPYMEPTLYNYEMQAVMQTNKTPSSPDARRMWNLGIDGSGQLVAIADTGIDFDHRFFRESSSLIVRGDVYNVTDLSRRKLVRYQVMGSPSDPWSWRDSAYGDRYCFGHGTLVSGTFGGRDDDTGGSSLNDGNARGAKIYMQDIASVCDPGYDCLVYIPSNLADLFGPAYDAGARIHSDSWGTPGENGYDAYARMVDEFMWSHPDMLIIFANGNGGPGGSSHYDVSSPATAKSALSAGWGDPWPNQNSVSGVSSRGPTSDGRMKPTLIGVGEGTSSRSSGNPWDNSNIARELNWMGTSYAAPTLASVAAMVREYFEEGWYPSGTKVPGDSFSPSAALVKAVLVTGGQRMTGGYSDSKNERTWPNDSQGWGRVLLDDALYFRGDGRQLEVVDNETGLSTGEYHTYNYVVTDSSRPLRVTLAWTDYPGAVYGNPVLVNDLDLLVIAPDGTTYKGNVFGTMGQGQSLPNTGSFDRLNPVEGVLVKNPAEGAWTVRVVGSNVPNGPQPYALVTLGSFGTDWGVVRMDRDVYSESDTIAITVEDKGAPSVDVSVYSDTEPVPEVFTLFETSPGSGSFAGIVWTTPAPPSKDGLISVSDGDTITVSYYDVSPPHLATANASVDASPPIVSGVFARNITFSSANIIWSTDEKADSTVFFGQTAILGNSTSDSNFTRSHDILLLGLQENTTYYFDVESSDKFNHSTLDDNGGSHYSFRTFKSRPSPPTNLTAKLFGPDWAHVRIRWDLSLDDATMVDHYSIYYGLRNYNPEGIDYLYAGEVPSGMNFFEHYTFGHGMWEDVFYLVRANTSWGTSSMSLGQAAKMTMWYNKGPQLVSIPLLLGDKSINSVLQTLRWKRARYYNPFDQDDHWKEYSRGKYLNDFLYVNRSIAFWVDLQASGFLTIAGAVPNTTKMKLVEGWNLVGFPSCQKNYTVAELLAFSGADKVEAFLSTVSPYYLMDANGTYVLSPMNGYWVHMPLDSSWTISWWRD